MRAALVFSGKNTNEKKEEERVLKRNHLWLEMAGGASEYHEDVELMQLLLLWVLTYVSAFCAEHTRLWKGENGTQSNSSCAE